MKRSSAVLFALLLLAACSDSPSGDAGTPGIDSATDAGTTTGDMGVEPPPDGGDAGSIDTGSTDRGPAVAGLVKDETGAILPNIMVLACQATTCAFGNTESDGTFFFPLEPPVVMIMKTLESGTTNPRRAEGIQPIIVSDGSFVDVGTLYVPLLGAGVMPQPAANDPQTLLLGDSLELTLNRGDLIAPVGARLTNMAARAVPPERQPRFPGLAEEIVAVYALFPFGTKSRTPVGVKFESALGAGTAVNFRTVDELDGHLSDPIAGHADGTHVSTDPGTGISALTWLVVSKYIGP